MPSIVLIAHNLRSCHNVGSLLRTAEGLGIEAVWLTGYTPYPAIAQDSRMPHEANKLTRQIHKTALGAEHYQPWFHREDIFTLIKELRSYGYTVASLEQSKTSKQLHDYSSPERIALIVGREVEGVEPKVLRACDITLEIPMSGKKESFNVASATAMALYQLKFAS